MGGPVIPPSGWYGRYQVLLNALFFFFFFPFFLQDVRIRGRRGTGQTGWVRSLPGVALYVFYFILQDVRIRGRRDTGQAGWVRSLPGVAVYIFFLQDVRIRDRRGTRQAGWVRLLPGVSVYVLFFYRMSGSEVDAVLDRLGAYGRYQVLLYMFFFFYRMSGSEVDAVLDRLGAYGRYQVLLYMFFFLQDVRIRGRRGTGQTGWVRSLPGVAVYTYIFLQDVRIRVDAVLDRLGGYGCYQVLLYMFFFFTGCQDPR